MITKQVIESIYKKYRRRPKSVDILNVGLLFDPSLEKQNIEIDDSKVVIGSLPADSPFHEIPLERIHAILDFDLHVAIVLHSSIIFLRKNSDKVDVHINFKGPSLLDRVRMALSSQ